MSLWESTKVWIGRRQGKYLDIMFELDINVSSEVFGIYLEEYLDLIVVHRENLIQNEDYYWKRKEKKIIKKKII